MMDINWDDLLTGIPPHEDIFKDIFEETDTEAKCFSLLTNELVRQDSDTFYWFGVKLNRALAMSYFGRRYNAIFLSNKIVAMADDNFNPKFYYIDCELNSKGDPYTDNQQELFAIINSIN